ncbi:autotransporter outer membrane beta-barrel domain-containing protein [Legionella spiritensis]|uniref:autotransporter outer membrane beta-barrel domain-containing protein n=1 Tax=Legionella spiritensis TaxID=452 RepID=UPI000F7101AC|nr:autotransporter outer membrane beta-barrel domain-containing protein [Legionella spiritensis]VEG89611.1 Uncharacterised protein [Legionella spiritensis]
MRIKAAMVIGMSLCTISMVFGSSVVTKRENQTASQNAFIKKRSSETLERLTPELLYSYLNFKFDSTSGNNFNRFHGHANQYGIGGNYVWFKKKNVLTGLYIFNVDTYASSQFFVTGNNPTALRQSIHNQTLLGHVLKSFNPNLFLDISGAYGINKQNYQMDTTLSNGVNLFGTAHSRNSTWFASLAAIYSKSVKTFLITANARVLYSSTNSGNYTFKFQDPFPPGKVAPQRTNVTWIMENLELDYKWKEGIVPFVNGGLIQVARFANDRQIIITPVNGALPQLSLNKDGFRVGGGVQLKYKSLYVRLEQKYYSAGGSYTNNLTLIKLKYKMS